MTRGSNAGFWMSGGCGIRGIVIIEPSDDKVERMSLRRCELARQQSKLVLCVTQP